MEFNENWNKSDNDLLREMNKEGKSTQDIINFFGMEKLKFHPTKFKYGNIIPYERFINEIIIQSEKVWYNINQRTSEIDNTKYDYLISFEIKNKSI